MTATRGGPAQAHGPAAGTRRRTQARNLNSRESAGTGSQSPLHYLHRRLLSAGARHYHPDQETPGPPPSGPRFPVPAESGIGDSSSLFPDSGRVGNRGVPVSRKNGKSGESGIRFLSDEYQLQWTRNILSREYHASAFTGTGSMRLLLFRVRDSERAHAAVSAEHQLQWTPHTP